MDVDVNIICVYINGFLFVEEILIILSIDNLINVNVMVNVFVLDNF